jgi:cytochrome oxidase assembly protein ShyY1
VSARAQRRGMVLPSLVALMAFAVLIAIGAWQLERKAWKETLIATLTQRLAAAPVDFPSAKNWGELTPENSEFRRVKARLEFLDVRDVFVYASGSALRDDIKSPGYFIFAPARLAEGRLIVINRGFVPATQDYPGSARPTEIIGYLRWPEQRQWFMSDHDPASDTWIVRDHLSMAKEKRWGEVAPFYIEQESPLPSVGLPRPAPLKPSLSNNHLQYALTWYGLAAVLAVVFTLWARSRRRAPFLAGG